MKFTETWRAVLRLLRIILLIDLVLLAGIGIICYVVDWRTVYQYGDLLTKVGAVLLILLLLIGLGGNTARSDDIEAFSVSGSMRMEDVLLEARRASDTRAHFIFAGLIALVMVILIGSLLLTLP